MVTPSRFTSGLSLDAPWQPLGRIGEPSPMFYHRKFDDFDQYDTNQWTTVTTSTGTVAVTPGDGGLVLATTAATNADVEGFHAPVAGFTFSPPNGTTVAGKKLVFLARLSLSSILSGFTAGMMNLTATPFAPTDGVYIQKLENVAAINLISMVGSVPTSIAIPSAAYSAFFANGATFDVGFLYDPSNGQGSTPQGAPNLYGFIGQNLVGYQPQSGSGALNAAGNPPRQPVVSFFQVNGANPTLTTANLTPTVAVQAPSAAAVTMTVDFVYASKER